MASLSGPDLVGIHTLSFFRPNYNSNQIICDKFFPEDLPIEGSTSPNTSIWRIIQLIKTLLKFTKLQAERICSLSSENPKMVYL